MGVGVRLGLVALSLRIMGVFVGNRLVLGARQLVSARRNHYQLAGDDASRQGTSRISPPTAPPAPVMGHRPSIMVGRIGQAPAYIPGGPVPPNFRSVIDHSSLIGMTSPMTGRREPEHGGSGSRRLPEQFRMSESDAAPANARTFAAPGTAGSRAGVERDDIARGHNRSGHVFAASGSGVDVTGLQLAGGPGVGRSIGPVQGSGAPMQGSAAPMRSSGGTSRAASPGGAAHGAASAQSQVATRHSQ